MPSTLIGAQSGGVQLVSGNFFSGTSWPHGGIQLKASRSNSGHVYVGLSGGVTQTSGGALASGGMLDGMEVAPGDAYFIPKLVCSGRATAVFITCDPTVSGRCRVFWEGL